MDTIMQSQVFFFISSIGFVTLWIMVAIFIFYLIRATKALSRIVDKIEKSVDEIGDTTKEMLEDLRESTLFNMFFKRKKRKETKTK
jgi:large-conductance mechanosensitive channel